MAGGSELSGALEVCLSQRWGTVNGDGWTAVDTLVACRQMGFNTAGKLGNLDKEVVSLVVYASAHAC